MEVVKFEQEKAVPAIVEMAHSVVVTSVPQYEQASLFLDKVKKQIKAIEDERVTMTKPISEGLKAINAKAKEVTAPLEEAKSVITKIMLDFKRAEDERIRKENEEKMRIAQEEQNRIIEEARKKQEEADAIAEATGTVAEVVAVEQVEVQLETVTANTIGKATVTKRWTFEVVNPAIVPAEYLIPDQVKIGKAVRSEGVREIPGVRIYQTENL